MKTGILIAGKFSVEDVLKVNYAISHISFFLMNFRRFSVLRCGKFSYEKVSFITWILQSQKHNRGNFHHLRVRPNWNHFTAGLTISRNEMQQEKFQLNFSAKFVWEMQIHHVWSEYYVLQYYTFIRLLLNNLRLVSTRINDTLTSMKGI